MQLDQTPSTPANRTLCQVQRAMSQAEAADIAREFRRQRSRVPTMPIYCAPCDAYHIVGTQVARRAIKPRTKAILEKYAMGLMQSEIEKELGLTGGVIKNAILQAKFEMGALSLHHLLVLSTVLGLIDPFDLVPKVKKGKTDGKTDCAIQRYPARRKVAASRGKGA